MRLFKKKSIVSIALSLSLCFSIFNSSTINASEICHLNDSGIQLVTDLNLNIDYTTKIPLYNNEDVEVASFYKLCNIGYVIIQNDTGEILEFSQEENNKYLTDQNEKYYYGGPLAYYEETNSKGNYIVDVHTNEYIEKDEIDFIEANETTSQLSASKASSSTTSNSITLSTRAWDYNPDGRCGATAVSIILMWYDDHIDDSTVASVYEAEVPLIDYITNNYIPQSASYGTLIAGWTSYYYDKGRSEVAAQVRRTLFGDVSDVFSKIKNRINANRPLVVGLDEAPTYGNHWVVGTGYTDSSSDYVKVNDGWGNKNISINMNYVDGCVYVK